MEIELHGRDDWYGASRQLRVARACDTLPPLGGDKDRVLSLSAATIKAQRISIAARWWQALELCGGQLHGNSLVVLLVKWS